MKFVKHKVTTAKSKHTDAEFVKIKKAFLRELVETVEMEEIPAEMILNWDETAVKIVPTTMDHQGPKCVEVGGANEKRAITAVFCASLVGDFFLSKLFTKGKPIAVILISSSHLIGI